MAALSALPLIASSCPLQLGDSDVRHFFVPTTRLGNSNNAGGHQAVAGQCEWEVEALEGPCGGSWHVLVVLVSPFLVPPPFFLSFVCVHHFLFLLHYVLRIRILFLYIK
jgi:hypothetical protein